MTLIDAIISARENVKARKSIVPLAISEEERQRFQENADYWQSIEEYLRELYTLRKHVADLQRAKK